MGTQQDLSGPDRSNWELLGGTGSYWELLGGTVGRLLTGHLGDVPRHEVPGLDALHGLAVGSVHLAHLRLVFLQRLDGVLCIALLWGDGGRGEEGVVGWKMGEVFGVGPHRDP